MQRYLKEIAPMPLFKGVDEKDLPDLLRCLGGYLKTFKKNEIIYLESQEIHAVGVVLSGAVHMIKEDIDGEKTLLVSIKVGEVFGESFACGSRKDARVSFVAVSPCVLLFLPFQKVMHSCSNSCVFHSRLIENTVRIMCDKNVMLMNKLEVVSKKTLRDKILCYLHIEAQHQGKNRFTIPFGRSELAEYLCANRSALSRELSLMKKENRIDFHKNTFTLY